MSDTPVEPSNETEEIGIETPPTTMMGILKRLGPGLIVAGSIVGSGELIATTKTGAEAGFWLLWLIIIGCVIKVFVQVEFGRYTISSGKTSLYGLNEVPGPAINYQLGGKNNRVNWIMWYWLLMTLASLAQLGGIVGGVGQALQISVPLTEQGRIYNDFTKVQTLLQVKETLVIQAEKRGDEAEAKKVSQEIAKMEAGLDNDDNDGDEYLVLRRKRSRQTEITGTLEGQAFNDFNQVQEQLEKNDSLLSKAKEDGSKLETARLVTEIADAESKLDALGKEYLVLRRQYPINKARMSDIKKSIQTDDDKIWFTDDKIWATIIAVATSLLLVVGRYGFIQTFSTVMVVSFTLITIGNLFALQMNPDWAVTGQDIINGLSFNFTPITEVLGKSPMATALATFGIIGVGAAELISYPYWCQAKGYAKFTGPRDDSPEWAARAKGWLHVLRWDAWGSMVVYTFATIAFYLLGAAILGRAGLNPEGSDMIQTLSVMYEPVFGSIAPTLFLFGAFAVLYSTFFVANASHARVNSDGLRVYGFIPMSEESYRKTVRILSGVFPMVCLSVYIFYPKPAVLILLSGVMQAVMLPMLSAAALYFRYYKTDPRTRPGIAWDVFLWLSAFGMLIAGSWAAYTKLF